MGKRKQKPEASPAGEVLEDPPAVQNPAETSEANPTTGEESAAGLESSEETRRLGNILESVLFAAGTPVSLKQMVQILEGPSAAEIQLAIAHLQNEYGPGARGIQLFEVSGGYQFRTARENAEWVRALFREKPARLGRATLETLAVIAYKQPVTKAEIEAIRGVDVDGTLSTLMSRRLIKLDGRKEAVGRPLLYATTPEFLEAFQLKDLQDLPSLKELGAIPENSPHEIDPLIDTTQAAPVETDGVGGDVPEAEGDLAAAHDTFPSGASAEDPQSSGDLVEAASGGDDSQWPDPGERQDRDGAGDEGEPSD